MKDKANCRIILDMNIHGIHIFDEFGYYNYTNAQPVLPIHVHKDMLEICYLSKGKQKYYVYNEIFEIQGGDLFITFPNELHGTGENPEEKGTLYWMVLKEPSFENNYLGLKNEEAKELYWHLQNLPCRFFKGSSKCESLLQEIMRIYFSDTNVMNRITLNNLLIAFFLEIIKCANANIINHVYNSEISSILIHIEKNLSEIRNLEELANKCNLSLSRFKHLFKKEVGIPPTEYINRKKVEKAELLLFNSNLSIKNIAYDLGFSSPAYFTTVFKQYKGYPPTMNRKK